MKLSILSVIGVQLLTVTLISVKASAQASLSPVALECYNQVMKTSDVLKMNKGYKNDSEVQKLAIAMCTYSDAAGAIGCYRQAMSQSAIFPHLTSADIFTLEQHASQLCSNSHEGGKNADTKDFDAIDCFKGVSKDKEVLTGMRKYMSGGQFDLQVKAMCISSNAKGAIECYKTAKANLDMYPSNDYQDAARIDAVILSNCRASRVR